MGKKITNLKKKGLFRPKKQAGTELKKKKKKIFGQKIDQFKKKYFLDQKNKLGLSLRSKKEDFLG